MAKSVLKLAVDTGQWDAGLKKAKSALDNFTQSQGGLQQALAKDSDSMQKFVRMMGQTESTAKTAKGQMNDYKSTIEQLTMQYNRMSDAQKKTIGQDYLQSIDQLKQKYKAVKQDLASINKDLGDMKTAGLDFNSVLGQLGNNFGISSELLGTLTTGTVAYTAAITAGAAAVAYAAKEWANYNSELAKQQQITGVTTGLKGGDADNMTAAVRALARTYDVDFRQGINAANTLMSQFGATGDEAIQLLKDGMQGMIQGDGGKLLSMIQQYAPAFRDAGVSASQLIAVIQNSEGGIFTDQNMNAIVMGIKNIRLMTNATSDALAQLGIDGQKMSQDLTNGTITVFDALKQVAEAIDTVGSGSKAAGEVMQTVFGRQGAMSGTKLGEAIATLNLNLEETKTQTGEVGESLARLNEQTERFEQTLMETAGFDGWDTMSNDIKTGVLISLNETLESVREILSQLGGIAAIDLNATGMAKFFTDLATEAANTIFPLLRVSEILVAIKKGIDELWGNPVGNSGGSGQSVYGSWGHMMEVGNSGGDFEYSTGDVTVTAMRPTPTTKPRGGGSGSRRAGTAATVFEDGSIAAQEQEVQKLRKLWREAGDEGIKNGYLAQLIEAENVLKRMNEQATLQRERAEGKLLETKPVGDIGMLDVTGNGVGGVDVLGDLKKGAIDLRTPLEALEEELQRLIEKQQQFGGISAETWQSYQSEIDDAQNKINTFQGKTKKGAEDSKQSWRQAAQAVTTVGGALQQIDDPAAKILGIVGQAIAQVALGFAQANANTGKEGNIWNWIAATAAGLVTMVTTISQIHAATGYAQGGIVKGNSYSGDNVLGQVGDGGELVGLNAGEVVLTRAMQGNLASQLQGSGLGTMQLSASVKGEQLILAINNTGKRTGMGEMVFWR